MKLALTGIAMTLALGGCTLGQQSKVKEEVREATGQTRPNFRERRNQFISQSETRLKDIETDINKMKVKPTKAGAAEHGPHSSVRTAILQIKDGLRNVKGDLEGLKRASAEQWEEQKDQFLNKMNELEDRFAHARDVYMRIEE